MLSKLAHLALGRLGLEVVKLAGKSVVGNLTIIGVERSGEAGPPPQRLSRAQTKPGPTPWTRAI